MVERVAARDRDTAANAAVRYRLQRGAYDDFAIEADTGVVTLARRLDHERRHQYSIEVLAVDSGEYGGAAGEGRMGVGGRNEDARVLWD